MYRFVLTIFLGLAWIAVIAQEGAPGGSEVIEEGAAQSSIHLKRITDPIILDGNLEEESWISGRPAEAFWQHFPSDSAKAIGQTEIYMCYDDTHLYVAVKCYSKGENFIISSLKRDYSFSGSDNISLVFDTYNDETNAFLFGINPYGVRREALISNGGRTRESFSSSWDNKWSGEAKMYSNYWVGEFAIPFKTIRFQEGSEQWRFNAYRSDTQINELSTWINVPQNQTIMDLTYMGKMLWDEALPKTGTNISFIPYTIAKFNRDYENANQEKWQRDFDIGGDAKIAITSGLNLDLTANPDFSQVEVDEQVTNLDRFEIFFPEKRQFFLENADLFGNFGLQRVNPFFSRRIGIARDTTTGINIQNPIYYGARLSGKLNENFRIGLLNMQTAPEKENGLPSFNYTVAALQQKVFKRSNLSFILVNKQAINSEDSNGDFNEYNRVAGLEYRLASADNHWTGKAFYHQAITTHEAEDKFAHGAEISYQRRKYKLEWGHLMVGNGFDAEVGFVPRRDYLALNPKGELFFYPKKGILNEHSIGFDYRMVYKIGKDDNEFLSAYSLADRELDIQWDLSFKNRTRGRIQLTNNHTFLLTDFDPTRSQDNGALLYGGSIYNYTYLSGFYSSDQRKTVSYFFSPTIGQFYNGIRAGVRGRLGVRYQPYGRVSVDFSYNYINLDEPFEPVNLWLIGPRVDFTFTKNIFFTTFIQYNNQLNNLNINARFQWRFKPVSDFFIVYTDNYLTDPWSQFSTRNRALVAKVTYWLNL